jgi:hypothetical protein
MRAASPATRSTPRGATSIEAIAPLTDRGFCGASGACSGATDGTACVAGQVCAAGSCQISCPGSQINCNGTCVDPLTDRGFCGASGACSGATDGTACVAGQVCSAGSCTVSCPGMQINCNGTCVDPLTDRGFCGASGTCSGATDGTACVAGQVCSAGSCQVSCPTGQVNCGGTCVDPLTDRGFCGASGSCTGGSVGSACAAGRVCSGGSCQVSCPSPQIECGGHCVDPQTDRGFCGASGNCSGVNDGAVCPDGQVCSGGVCGLTCASPQIICGMNCIDPATNRTFCGATGNCSGVNDGTVCAAGEVCSSGVCGLTCASPQIICGMSCVDPTTNRTFCGATGNCSGVNDGTVCADGEVCSSGTCQTSCGGSQIKCGTTCIDPSSNPTYCGADGECGSPTGSAGAPCNVFQACVGGSCMNLDLKIVFITSTVYNGNLGGLAGADAACQARATAASLPGTYKAWLSDDVTTAASRLTHSTGRYVSPTGLTVGIDWNDVVNAPLNRAINIDEFGHGAHANGTATSSCASVVGYAVYTGSDQTGASVAGSTCSNWTDNTTGSSARFGDSGRASFFWTNRCTVTCDRTAPLYCFQQ